MKFNKIAKKFAAAALAGVLAVSMLSTSVCAAETTTATSALTKKISKEANAYAPNTTFTFTITSGTEQTGLTESDGSTALASPAGGLVFSDTSTTSATINSTPSEGTSDIGETTLTVGTLSLKIDSSKFTTPGVYRYVIAETEGSYEGIIYDTTSRYVDVYIYSDGTYAILFVNEDGTTKDDGIFTNEYDKTGDGEDPDSKLYDMTVTKHVTGNQYDANKSYTFTIKVTGAEGEKYYVTYGASGTATITSGSSVEITLKADESAVIYGLSKSDEVVITETDYSSEGYTTYISTGSELAASDYSDTYKSRETTESYGEANDAEEVADVTVNVYNDKETTTPTGIALSIAPYVLMVAFAGVIAVLFLRKRNYEI